MKNISISIIFLITQYVSAAQAISGNYQPLQPYKAQELWGYRNGNGALIIPAQFDAAGSFSENVAVVIKDRKHFLIDTTGRIIREVTVATAASIALHEQMEREFFTIQVGERANVSGTGRRTNSPADQCPANLDFEFGNFTNWNCFNGRTTATGNVNQIIVDTAPPTYSRHTLYNANTTQTDYYGGFSIKPPNSSNYALKLGNDKGGGLAERVRYVISVPANNPDYSVTFQYAVVLENPDSATIGVVHEEWQQPRFTAKLFDPATGEYIPCGSFTFVASQAGTIPSFFPAASPGGIPSNPPGARIWCKDWSSVYINLSRYQGRTLYLEFTTADCTLGGHFGYAYVDVNECATGSKSTYSCSTPHIATLTAPPGFQSYKWYNDNFTVSYGNSQSVTINPAPALGTRFHVVVKPYNNTGCTTCNCTDTLTNLLTAATPTALAGSDQVVCAGQALNIGAPPIAGYSYKWSPATGLSSATIANPIVLAAANEYYVLTVTDNNTKCTASDTVKLSTIPKPHAAFSISQAGQCLDGNSFTFSNSSSANTGTVSSQWDFGDGVTSTQLSPSHAYLVPGSFTVCLKVISANGCIDSLKKDITVFDKPSARFNIDNASQCLKNNLFRFSVVPAAGSHTYSWNFGDGTGAANGPNPTHAYATAGNYTVKLLAKTANGCRDSLEKQVVVKPMPVTGFALNSSGQCVNNNQFVFSNTSGVSNGTFSSDWSFGDGAGSSSALNPVYTYSQPGNYMVRLVVTSNLACSDTVIKPVTVFPKPNPVIAILKGGQCLAGNTFNFTNNSSVTSGNLIFSWDFGDTSYSSAVSPVHHYLYAGDHHVKLVAVTNNNCRDSANAIISVFSAPVVSIQPGGPLNLCAGDSLRLTGNFSAGTGTVTQLQWYKDYEIMNGVNEPGITVTTPGTYILEVTNSNGCTSRSSVVVTVNPVPEGSLLNPATNTICQGDKVVLHATGGQSYNWYRDGLSLAGSHTDSIAVTQQGTYHVEIVNQFGCKLIATNKVLVNMIKKPAADFTFETSCINSPMELINASDVRGSGGIVYRWVFSDGAVVSSTNAMHTFNTAGNYSIKLIVSSTGCARLTDSLVKQVTILKAVPNTRYTTINAVANIPVQLEARPGTMYHWNNAAGLSNPNIVNPLFKYDRQQEYTVSFKNQSGCLLTDTVLVKMFKNADVYVPDAFTPNRDGLNDYMHPVLTGNMRLSHFRIYNRWGQVVFETSDAGQQKGWDGMLASKEQPVGTYVWTVEAFDGDNNLVRKTGTCMLIR